MLDRLGYAQHELTGQNVLMMHPPDLQAAAERIMKAMAEGTAAECSLPLQTRDGKQIAAVTRVVRGTWEGRPAIFGITRDMTEQALSEEIKTANARLECEIAERKKVESQLVMEKEKAEAASRIKSNFLANMSHEFRTPLNGILGLAELLYDQMDNPEQKKIVDFIMRSGERLFTMLDSLIRMTQLSAGEYKVNIKRFWCSPLARSVVREFQEKAREKNLSLILDIVHECEIEADEDMVDYILHHLIDNALKFTFTGEIRVMVDQKNSDANTMACIHVKDTGIGITAEQGDILFQEFRQISEGSTRNYEGSGLGLTVAKKMTDLLGGVLTFESAIGTGSTFTVSFPAGIPPQNFHTPPLQETPCPSSAVPGARENAAVEPRPLPLVLLVEDNFINAHVIISNLESICLVKHASSGEEALSMAGGHCYTAMLIDINLGRGIDGIMLLREIRAIPVYKNVPIVAITGYALSGDKQHMLDEGFDYYLSKPFALQELEELMKSILLCTHP